MQKLIRTQRTRFQGRNNIFFAGGVLLCSTASALHHDFATAVLSCSRDSNTVGPWCMHQTRVMQMKAEGAEH